MYLDNNRFYGYIDSYNYYDIDVDKIIIYKRSDNEYFIRYYDVKKINYVPLQLKIKIFSGKIHKFKNYITLIYIQSDDKNFFRTIREIQNKIIELIGINNAKDFVKNTIDADADEVIMVDVHKNTSPIESNYRDKIAIVLHSIIYNHLKTSLVQVKTHKYT